MQAVDNPRMTATSSAATPTSKSARFDQLALASATLQNLEQLGYAQMTPIQAATLPLTLAAGMLLIFPSYLAHHTHPYNAQEPAVELHFELNVVDNHAHQRLRQPSFPRTL